MSLTIQVVTINPIYLIKLYTLVININSTLPYLPLTLSIPAPHYPCPSLPVPTPSSPYHPTAQRLVTIRVQPLAYRGQPRPNPEHIVSKRNTQEKRRKGPRKG